LSPRTLGIVCVLALPGLAEAGDRTRTARRLRGDLDIGYAGRFGAVRLQDTSDLHPTAVEVARGSRQTHGLRLRGAFAPFHGLEVSLDLPIVLFDRLRWAEANEFRWDPDALRPTMAGGSAVPADVLATSRSSRTHRGPADLGLALRFVPFGPGVTGREVPGALAIDVGLRAPTGGNPDRVRQEGSSGPGEGGPAFVLAVTAQRRAANVEPYASVRWEAVAPYRVELTDAAGNALSDPVDGASGTKLDPADQIGLSVGAEIIAMEDAGHDAEVRVDLGFSLRYVGKDEVSSGTRLPAPLDPTVGHVAVSSDHVEADFSVGVRIRPKALVEVRIDLGGDWTSAHRVEHVSSDAYRTKLAPDAFAAHWGLTTRIRFR
jgi:hypothetical protein